MIELINKVITDNVPLTIPRSTDLRIDLDVRNAFRDAQSVLQTITSKSSERGSERDRRNHWRLANAYRRLMQAKRIPWRIFVSEGSASSLGTYRMARLGARMCLPTKPLTWHPSLSMERVSELILR